MQHWQWDSSARCLSENYSEMKEEPKYLAVLRHMILRVPATVVFSVLFIWVFRPFWDVSVLALDRFTQTAGYAWFWVATTLVMLAARAIRFALYDSSRTIIPALLLQWLVELMMVGGIYLFFTNMYLFPDREITISLILKVTLYMFGIVSIPFTIVTLVSALLDNSESYEALKAGVRAQQFANDSRNIHLFDHKDEYKLSLRSNTIFYAEAQDNYTHIFYEEDGVAQNYLLRCPISKFEKQVEGSRLVRCHRSYVVNLDHVAEFVKGRSNSTLILDNSKSIPVSKSYHKVLPASIVNGSYL